MPIYSYHCPKCRLAQDVLKKMEHAAEPEECSTCHSQMERLLDPPAAKVAGGTQKFHFRKLRAAR